MATGNGKGYELKATLSLSDKFTTKMSKATESLKTFQNQVKSVERAVNDMQNASSTMFSGINGRGGRRPTSVLADTSRMMGKTSQQAKQTATHFEQALKGSYTFAQQQKANHQNKLKMQQIELRENKRIEKAGIVEAQKGKNKLAQIEKSSALHMNNFKQKTDMQQVKWEQQKTRSMNDFKEKEELKYQKRMSLKREQWSRQDAKAQERAAISSQNKRVTEGAKARRRAADFIYGTNSGYGRFQYGMIPQAARIGAGVVGTTAAVGTAVAGSQLKSSVTQAAGFEQSIADIKAVTTGSDYKNWNKGVGDKIKNYVLAEGLNTSFSNVEVAQSYKELLKAGRSNEQIIGNGTGKNGDLAATLALSTATDFDPTASSNLISTMMTTFNKTGMKNRKGEKVKTNSMDMADLIAGVSNAAVTDPQDLALGMMQAGNVASGFGWTPNDTATMIGLMSKDGITKGQVAGSTMKVGMTTMLGLTKPARQKLFKYGLTKNEEGDGNVFFDEKGQLKQMSEISGLIHNAFKDTSSQERMTAFTKLGGTRGMKFWESMYQNGANNGQSIKDFQAESTSKGVLDMQNDRKDTLAFRGEQFRNMMDTMKIDFGSGLLGPLGKIIDSMNKEFGKFRPTLVKWGENAGKAIQGWWDGVTSSPTWKKLQKTDGLGAKLKFVWDSALKSVGNWWSDGGGGEAITSALAKGITFLFSEVLVPVASKVLEAAWGAWQGFGEDHPMIKKIVEVAAMGWIVRKVSNIFLWITDIITAFKTMGMLSKGLTLSQAGAGLVAGAAPTAGAGATVIGGLDAKGNPAGKASFLAKSVSFLGAVTMTIAAATIAIEAGKMLGGAINDALDKHRKKQEKQAQEKIDTTANMYSFGENGTKKDKNGKTVKNGSDSMAMAQNVDFITSDLKQWYGVTDEEIKRISLFVSKGKTSMADELSKSDFKGFEKYWNLYREKVRKDGTFDTADQSKPSDHIKTFDYTDKAYQDSLKEESDKQQKAVQGLINGAKNLFVNFETVGAAVKDRDQRISMNWISKTNELIGGTPIPEANLTGVGVALNTKISNIVTGVKSTFQKFVDDWTAPGTPAPRTGLQGETQLVPSKAGGEYRVPSDGLRLVHKDETILPRGEARAYRNGQGGGSSVVIGGNTFHVREEADIEKIALALARQLQNY